MFQLEVRSRIVGSVTTEPALSDVVLELLEETLTVSELITLTVEEQIRDLLTNRQLDVAKTQQLLKRQYLTNEDIQQQAASGAIRLPNAKRSSIPQIDTVAEVQHALRAFEKKTYLIVVDGYQPETLDERISLHATSKVTFMRLTPLIGG